MKFWTLMLNKKFLRLYLIITHEKIEGAARIRHQVGINTLRKNEIHHELKDEKNLT
jgi:hypothetical protein